MAGKKRQITNLVLPPGANTDLQIIQDAKVPVAKWVRVTPDLATAWLEKNTNNRLVRDAHVLRLAADMKAGKWRGRNGEAIRFDSEGRLVDGQHRLWACLECGVTFETLLITNLAPEVYSTIGVGRPKNFGDFLGPMHHEKNTTLLAAACRRVYYWQNGLLPTMKDGRQAPTIAALEQVLKEHPTIRESVSRAASMSDTKKLLTSSYIALVHYAGTLEGKNATVESFLERLGKGEGLYATDPIFHLRNLLLQQRGPKAGSRRAGQQYILACVIKAWNATKKEQKMLALRFATAESFPQL